MNRNYCVILAAGSGKRMGKTILPKQFLSIDNKPIIICSIERILSFNLFEKVIIALNESWVDYCQELLSSYEIDTTKIEIVLGGEERINSIENSINYLQNQHIDDEDIVVFHDSVRPFVSLTIMENSIEYANLYGVAVAAVQATDTIYIVDQDKKVVDCPSRSSLVCGQSPDSFKFHIIRDSIQKLTEAQRQFITGTIQICAINGYTPYCFDGDDLNFKITTKKDYFLAKSLKIG